jgi:hypothetical protein
VQAAFLSKGIHRQAAYGELQQQYGGLGNEVKRLRETAARSPGASGPPSVDQTAGDAATRLRQMHAQLAEQELQLTSARAEIQVPLPLELC